MLSFGLIGLGGATGCDSRLPPAPANREANGNWRRLLPAASIGALQAPDANGFRLPQGFSSRVIARSGEPVASTGYVWHDAPDGGATFATEDGGWIYVSNAEIVAPGGGVSAVVSTHRARSSARTPSAAALRATAPAAPRHGARG